jgi:histidine triad (HIT) family protein
MSDGCLFCAIIAGATPSRQVYADDSAVAFLDIQPWHRGHTLVVPRRHVASIIDDPTIWGDVRTAVEHVVPLLVDGLRASGLNALINAGEVSGQEVMHFHVHLVPRYDDAPGLANLIGRDATDLDSVWQRLTA